MIRAGSVEVARPLFFQVEGGGSIPTSALNLLFEECDMRRAMELNREWHSVLPKTNLGNLTRNRRYVAYTAEFDGIIYAVAIWTSPVAANRLKDGENRLELRRMAISGKAPKNTASRMIGWMRKDVKRKWTELIGLISYQDTEKHKGTIYAASGWTPIDTTKSLTKWNTNGRARNKEQSTAPKIRWEWWY
jgi:hypothetical protein